MKITKNFELAEFIKSPTAEKLNIDNTPRNEYINNIIKLVEKIMQPIRDEIGQPITITSGFRCNILNNAIGGAKTSQHLTGDACDFKVKGGKKAINEVFDIIKKMIEDKKITVGQAINEKGGSWIHISNPTAKLKNHILYIK